MSVQQADGNEADQGREEGVKLAGGGQSHDSGVNAGAINEVEVENADKVEGKSPSADDLIPIFILVVIRSHCPNLLLNIDFIANARSPSLLKGEDEYFFVNLQSATQFVMNSCAQNFNCTEEEYDKAMQESRQLWTDMQTEQVSKDKEEDSEEDEPALAPNHENVAERAGDIDAESHDALAGDAEAPSKLVDDLAAEETGAVLADPAGPSLPHAIPEVREGLGKCAHGSQLLAH